MALATTNHPKDVGLSLNISELYFVRHLARRIIDAPILVVADEIGKHFYNTATRGARTS